MIITKIKVVCYKPNYEPPINDVTHLGEGVSVKRWYYSIGLFSKMGDKGKRRIKNLKKWVTSFMDGPSFLFPAKMTSNDTT